MNIHLDFLSFSSLTVFHFIPTDIPPTNQLTQVTHTSYNFGAGDAGNAVALLLSIFRSSSWSGSGSNNPFSSSSTSNISASTSAWTPAAFGTQVLLVALECLLIRAQHGKEETGLWKGFVLGRVGSFRVVLFEFFDGRIASFSVSFARRCCEQG
jgi:hypothetical protein